MLSPRTLFHSLLLIFLVGAGIAHAESWTLKVCADPNAWPMSHIDGTGYENAVAEILADELDADLSYDWHLYNEDLINLRFRAGHCDVVMGIPDGTEPFLTTIAYYRSPYVFLYREDAPFEVTSLDDEVLSTLRIGLQDISITPHDSLIERGLRPNVTAEFGGARRFGADNASGRAMIVALEDGAIDIGIGWGAWVGQYATLSSVPLKAVPVRPEFEVTPPFRSMVVPMVIGVRRGDEAFRDLLNQAIASRWDDIQAVLERFDVPLTFTPRPQLGPQ